MLAMRRGPEKSGRLGGCSGQVEVETAIVMPAVVFLLLGLTQLGMLHQARLMTEYAAYRAVRTGAVKNANVEEMEQAAVAAALPILSRNGSGDYEVLDATDTPSAWRNKLMKPGFGAGGLGFGNRMMDVMMVKYAEVSICNPLKGDLSGSTYRVDGDDFVPFDDPAVAQDPDKTRLVIELTLNYRLVIPFADWVIYRMARGRNMVEELRLGKNGMMPDIPNMDKYGMAHQMGVSILPIRAQYSMKMHSDILLDTLPDENACIGGGGADDGG